MLDQRECQYNLAGSLVSESIELNQKANTGAEESLDLNVGTTMIPDSQLIRSLSSVKLRGLTRQGPIKRALETRFIGSNGFRGRVSQVRILPGPLPLSGLTHAAYAAFQGG